MTAIDDRLRAFLDELPAPAGAAVLAVGWATVDVERAAVELSPNAPVEELPDEVLLGARAVLLRDATEPGRPALVLLEPTTEGRLAATLARLGEGPAAAWIDPGGTGIPGPASGPRPGPFGQERLLTGGPVHGPHVLVPAKRPGTIGA